MDEQSKDSNGVPAADPRALAEALRSWAGYLREMGVYDLYRRDGASSVQLSLATREALLHRAEAVVGKPTSRPHTSAMRDTAPAARNPTTPSATRQEARQIPAIATRSNVSGPAVAAPPKPSTPLAGSPEPQRSYFTIEGEGTPALPPELAAPMPKPNPLEALLPQPAERVPPAQKAAALLQLQAEIGDCTRCPLAYAGRHTIVFGEGDPNAALMFVGEGPGADEDASGRPFVGKAGQLLENMIGAMGLEREQVYIANIVKCRPPGNRAPEFVEATTCSQFLLRQIDIVQPRVIVALGATAATYVLGVRQTLGSLRGEWFRARDSKVAVTFHPAFLLRDPRQKGEAWKDLQRVMQELGLQAPGRGA